MQRNPGRLILRHQQQVLYLEDVTRFTALSRVDMKSFGDVIPLSGTLAQAQNHTCIKGSQSCQSAERALSRRDSPNEDIHIRFG